MTTTITIHIMIDSEGNWASAQEADDPDAAFEAEHTSPEGATARYELEIEVPLPTATKVRAVIGEQAVDPIQLKIVR